MTTIGTGPDTLVRRYQADLRRRLPEHVARLHWSASQIADHQRTQLRETLAYALNHSPFHARRLSGVDPGRFELEDLPSLPTMTKADMMASFDDVVTDRRLTRRSVEAGLAATGARPTFIEGEYLALTSGGSSGVRGVYVFNRAAALDYIASVLRSSVARLVGGGELVVGMVAAPSAVHATGAARGLLDGLFGRVVDAPVTLPIDEIVAWLNGGQPRLVISYPSVMRLLAAEQSAGRLIIAPAAIITTSELLAAPIRDEISAAFGAPVINAFGSSEGLMGASPPGEDAIVFATDQMIVELVDERNRPVPAGEPSAKALLTNLYNRAQPLIRYEMPDSFVRLPDAPEHGYLRATVAGRTDEIFDYGDVRIHPVTVRSALLRLPAIVEYQVRQMRRGIDVDVVSAPGLDTDVVAERLRLALTAAGLAGAEVNVRTAPSIERNALTGKLQRFIPLVSQATG